ncbi:MAG: DUF3990 domain-containing protein [Oscillospiraceae bacterium]|nr:DUF3990 domain-containing protein [Oscillospiraceae bacterium]
MYDFVYVVVSQPHLVQQNRFLDFGFGFYTTTNKAQAISFADKVFKRRGSGSKVVSIYEFNEQTSFEKCFRLRFDTPSEDWLGFVSENREGNYNGEIYDLVYGPVANDDVYTIFALYSAGALNKGQTLEILKIKKLYDQLVLSSEKALSFLKIHRDCAGGRILMEKRSLKQYRCLLFRSL